jgi:hypothetical protein
MLSARQAKFHRLIQQANQQPTDWLIANVRQPGQYASKLSILACLRIIAARTYSGGGVYRERMRTTKAWVFA